MEWHVLYTRPRAEKKAADRLERLGFEVYCPTQKVLRQWSDRKKWVEMVLIPSYVFVKCKEKDRLTILQLPYIVNFVFWLGKPAQIREQEMQALFRFMGDYAGQEISVARFEPGQHVHIEYGPFKDKEGEIIHVKNNTARLRLQNVGIELVVEIEKSVLRRK